MPRHRMPDSAAPAQRVRLFLQQISNLHLHCDKFQYFYSPCHPTTRQLRMVPIVQHANLGQTPKPEVVMRE